MSDPLAPQGARRSLEASLCACEESQLRHCFQNCLINISTMKTGPLFAIVVLLAVSQGAVCSAQVKSACQSCVAGLNNVHNRLAYVNSNEEALQAQDRSCAELPVQQQQMCNTALKAGLPLLENKLQHPVQVLCCSFPFLYAEQSPLACVQRRPRSKTSSTA